MTCLHPEYFDGLPDIVEVLDESKLDEMIEGGATEEFEEQIDIEE